jgi:hypothetical protein
LFIGSSSEGEAVAEAVQSRLEDVADCETWKQGAFALNQNYLESLEAALDRFDFAILVLSPDDLTSSRGKRLSAPRDNVIFELGLFLGRLGRERAYFVYDKTAKLKLPSDLLGINAATYRPHTSGELEPALGPVCLRIKKQIKAVGPRTKLLQVSSVNPKSAASVPNIGGTWAGYSPEGKNPDIQTSTMRVEQLGSFIRAQVERQSESGKRVFEYEGKLASGQVVLFYEEVSGRGYIVGTMVLSLSGNMKTLIGKSTYLDHSRNEVVSSARRYVKVG